MKQISFENEEDYYNWKRDKIQLNFGRRDRKRVDAFYSLKSVEIYLASECSGGKYVLHTVSNQEISPCYGYVAEDVLIILGSGYLSSLIEISQATNGYPAGVWETTPLRILSKVYISNDVHIEPDDYVAFRGQSGKNATILPFDCDAVLRDSDSNHYYNKMSYEEYLTSKNNKRISNEEPKARVQQMTESSPVKEQEPSANMPTTTPSEAAVKILVYFVGFIVLLLIIFSIISL